MILILDYTDKAKYSAFSDLIMKAALVAFKLPNGLYDVVKYRHGAAPDRPVRLTTLNRMMEETLAFFRKQNED